MANKKLISDFGTFDLHRLPKQSNDPLQAWDAADELLLKHIHTEDLLAPLLPTPTTPTPQILIINDQFGALSCNLANYHLTNWSDSYIAHQACRNNTESLIKNIEYLPSTNDLSYNYSLVIIKIPKTLALLEHQLIALKPHTNSDSVIIAAGMSKYIHKSQLALFEKYLGTTTTSLAVKKARLIFCKPDINISNKKTLALSVINEPNFDISLQGYANVFSRDKLDIGARFMLEQFQKLPPAKNIIDLGCGNGVLGIIAFRSQLALYNIESHINFIDESYMAIASAKLNFEAAIKQHNKADYFANHSLENLSLEKTDLILCNPPFHQNHTTGDHIAWAMFQHSKQQLNRGGELWVVGNRHLSYHIKLKRLFGNVRTIASNKKFVVLAAKKHQ
jgi:16S rRNA G1207 methylase RsmC